MDASIGQFIAAGITTAQTNGHYPLLTPSTDMLADQPQSANCRQPLSNSESGTCGASEPTSPNRRLTGSHSASVNTRCVISLQGPIRTS